MDKEVRQYNRSQCHYKQSKKEIGDYRLNVEIKIFDQDNPKIEEGIQQKNTICGECTNH